MTYISINGLAILIATLASLGFGAGYYSLAGRAEPARPRADAAKLLPLLALAFVAEFWFAAILAGALILAPPEAGRWTMALGTAMVIWIGFVVPVLIVTHRYRGLPARSAAIDCGHWLGAMVIQAVVLQSIGLRPPPG